jgi:hypothetical protein
MVRGGVARLRDRAFEEGRRPVIKDKGWLFEAPPLPILSQQLVFIGNMIQTKQD